MADGKGISVLAGSLALMLVLGSIHAFSIFLVPIENAFEASRSQASFTYSLSLAVLTISVLFGHHVFQRLSAPLLACLVCGLAAFGAVLAGNANGLALVWIGYGIVFGAANGLGYGYALQFSAQANPRFPGTAMGLVTAFYGIGATVAPLPFELLVKAYGFQGGMFGLAAVLVIIAPGVALLYGRSGLRLKTETSVTDSQAYPTASTGTLVLLWIVYGTAVASGLMAIGHATGIASSAGLAAEWIVVAPTAIAIANVFGSMVGGHFLKFLSAPLILRSVTALSTLSLVLLAVFPGATVAVAGLVGIGFAYGAVIAAFPAAISLIFGPVGGVRVYSRVFTAWGTAGLLAPWVAGILFEVSASYTSALLMAAVLGVTSIVAITWFPASDRSSS